VFPAQVEAEGRAITAGPIYALEATRARYPDADARSFTAVSGRGETIGWTFTTGTTTGWVANTGSLVCTQTFATADEAVQSLRRYAATPATPAAEGPATLADPVTAFADEIAAREDEDAAAAEAAAHRAAKDRFPHAHTFRPLAEDDGRPYAWVFTAGLGSGAKMGWVSIGGQVCARTYVTRHDATLAAQAHNATQAAAEGPAPVVSTVAEARETVAPRFPHAQGFRPRPDDTGRTTGWTFRVDSTERARFGWVTTDGSYGKGTEVSRAAAAEMLVMGVLEDARARARRDQMARYDRLTDVAEATYPEANMWRKVRTPEGATVGWTFRTGYGTGARYAWILDDRTMADPDALCQGRIEADAAALSQALAAVAICAI
jgi:hypothetical protein